MTRRIGPRATALIKHFEGLKLSAYLCPAGVPTIGYGSTGPDVRMGMTITESQAERLLLDDLRRFEAGVEMATRHDTTAAEFGAMVSLAFNVGLANFRRSTLLRLHQQGKTAEAADQFLRWNRASGRVLAGLTRRREAERLLYLNDLPAFDAAIGYRP